MPFTPRSIDFLLENSFHDSREWFKAHKEEYQSVVIQPMTELIDALSPVILGIDKLFGNTPCRISRLYRDARYAQGRSIFRDNVWFSFHYGRGIYENPFEYYFYYSPQDFGYGLGWYMTPPDTLSVLREMIMEGNPLFAEADKALRAQNVFTLGGDTYKRDHYPNQPENAKHWLNRRSIHFSCERTDWDMFFSDSLIPQVTADLQLLTPMVRLLSAAQETAAVRGKE